MIGLDTNVIVRYLTQDDPVQSRKASELIEHRLTVDTPGFVSIVAMAETVWVLDRTFNQSPREIASIIERMLQIEVLLIEHEQEVFTAMIALREKRGDFADALIGALGAKAGCKYTLTFDQKALRLSDFQPA
ncbi:MAG: type II toxin-antitoxin system VapC family toxin [Candidatus Korobacteraceae bacterium]